MDLQYLECFGLLTECYLTIDLLKDLSKSIEKMDKKQSTSNGSSNGSSKKPIQSSHISSSTTKTQDANPILASLLNKT